MCFIDLKNIKKGKYVSLSGGGEDTRYAKLLK